MLALRRGPFPAAALAKAEAAYGEDVIRKLGWVLRLLANAEERVHAATVLDMDQHLLDLAVQALSSEFRAIRKPL